MIHECKSLSLRLEPSHDLLGVVSRPDQFQGNAAANRLLLLGQPYLSHAPFRDLLQQTVRSYDIGPCARPNFGLRRRGSIRTEGALVGRTASLLITEWNGLEHSGFRGAASVSHDPRN